MSIVKIFTETHGQTSTFLYGRFPLPALFLAWRRPPMEWYAAIKLMLSDLRDLFKVCVSFLGPPEQSASHWVAKTKETDLLSVLESRSLNSGSSGAGLPLKLWVGSSLLLSDVWGLLGILGAPELAPCHPVSAAAFTGPPPAASLSLCPDLLFS